MSEPTHSIYLGYRAELWAHRGHEVRSGRVLCSSKEEAESILDREFGELDLVCVEVDDGMDSADYYYESQEDADADRDGTSPLAVISAELPDKFRWSVTRSSAQVAWALAGGT